MVGHWLSGLGLVGVDGAAHTGCDSYRGLYERWLKIGVEGAEKFFRTRSGTWSGLRNCEDWELVDNSIADIAESRF